CLFEIQITGALEKSRLAFAVNNDAKMLGLAQIFKTRGSVEDALDRYHASANSCCERILRGLFEFLATRNAALQYLRCDEALIDALSRRFELVSAFQFHCTRAFAV